MTRREARIQAMQILYNADFNNTDINTAVKLVAYDGIEPEVIYFIDLVSNNLEVIDEIISKSLINYSINRLNLVDKAIIRLATAEMLKGDTNRKIIINEALEITKEYSDQGDHKAVAFNNRLLDSINKSI